MSTFEDLREFYSALTSRIDSDDDYDCCCCMGGFSK